MLNNENYRREICLLRLKAIYLRCFLVDLEIFSKSSLEVGSFLRQPLFVSIPQFSVRQSHTMKEISGCKQQKLLTARLCRSK